MSPLKYNFQNDKMLAGSLATVLKKKKLFRSELDHKFGFTPFYGTVNLNFLEKDRVRMKWKRIRIPIARPQMPIRIGQHDADLTGSGSTTLEETLVTNKFFHLVIPVRTQVRLRITINPVLNIKRKWPTCYKGSLFMIKYIFTGNTMTNKAYPNSYFNSKYKTVAKH